MTVEKEEWFHFCATWSLTNSGTLSAYHNGKLLIQGGGKTEPIAVGGNLVIGNDCIGGGTGNDGNAAYYPFGGELTQLNVFSKELTGAEIKAMADAGIGSSVEKTHGKDRRIRWEDILQEKRYGNIYQRESLPCLDTKCLAVGKFRHEYF